MRRNLIPVVIGIAAVVALGGCAPRTDPYAEPQAVVDRWAAQLTEALDRDDPSLLRSTTTNQGYGSSMKLLREELAYHLISGEFHVKVHWQPDPDVPLYHVCLDGEGMHLAKPPGDGLFSPSPIEQMLLIELVDEDGRLMVGRVKPAGQLYCSPPLQ